MRGDLEEARRAEIADFQEPFLGDEDVGGRRIAVDDALPVGVLDRIRN